MSSFSISRVVQRKRGLLLIDEIPLLIPACSNNFYETLAISSVIYLTEIVTQIVEYILCVIILLTVYREIYPFECVNIRETYLLGKLFTGVTQQKYVTRHISYAHQIREHGACIATLPFL